MFSKILISSIFLILEMIDNAFPGVFGLIIVIEMGPDNNFVHLFVILFDHELNLLLLSLSQLFILINFHYK